jgi:hypothetical protein
MNRHQPLFGSECRYAFGCWRFLVEVTSCIIGVEEGDTPLHSDGKRMRGVVFCGPEEIATAIRSQIDCRGHVVIILKSFVSFEKFALMEMKTHFRVMTAEKKFRKIQGLKGGRSWIKSAESQSYEQSLWNKVCESPELRAMDMIDLQKRWL